MGKQLIRITDYRDIANLETGIRKLIAESEISNMEALGMLEFVKYRLFQAMQREKHE